MLFRSGNKTSCPQGWTRWPPTSGAATPESTKGREPPEDKAHLGEVNPEEERDIGSSEARSQASQGCSDPEDNKIPLQPSAPWSEASNPESPLRHHLRIRQPTPPRPGPCQAVCWHWEDREGSDGGRGGGVPALQGFLLSGGRSMQSIQGGPLGALCMLWTELGQDGGELGLRDPLEDLLVDPRTPASSVLQPHSKLLSFSRKAQGFTSPRSLPPLRQDTLISTLSSGDPFSGQPSTTHRWSGSLPWAAHTSPALSLTGPGAEKAP